MKYKMIIYYIYSSQQLDNINLIQYYTKLNNTIKIIHFPKYELRDLTITLYKNNSLNSIITITKQIIKLLKLKITDYKFIQFIPFKRYKIIRQINIILNIILLKFILFNKKAKVIIFYNDLTSEVASFIHFLQASIVIADCTEYWTKEASTLSSSISNYTIVNSNKMFNYQSQFTKPILMSGAYFTKKHINLIHNKTNKQLQYAKTLVYIGSIDYRIDFKLLQNALTCYQDYNFYFLSDEMFDYDKNNQNPELLQKNDLARKEWYTIKKFPNCSIIPTAHHIDVLNNIKNYSVGIIPYTLDTIFYQFVHPVKIYFYFAAGIPVISAPLESINNYVSKYLSIYHTQNEFMDLIKYSSHIHISDNDKKVMLEICYKQTIENRILGIRKLITQ